MVAVERDPDGVTVTDVNGAARRFDRRRDRHPSRSGAGAACRSEPAGAPHPVQLRLLEQRDGAAHRRLAATPLERRAGVMELSARGMHNDQPRWLHVTYHLNRLQALDEPVEYCVTLEPERSHRARQRARADRLRASRLHDRLAGRPAALPDAVGRQQHRLLRRLPRLGISRGRLSSRASAQRWRWGVPGDRLRALRGSR